MTAATVTELIIDAVGVPVSEKISWENEGGPGGVGSTSRGLTRSLAYTRRG